MGIKGKVLLCLALLGWPIGWAVAGKITVAAASNLQFTLDEIINAFEKETGIKVNIILGSSGKLTAQIENGAPFDVFLSADEDYPQRLFQKGFTIGKPRVYAYGTLVLWTMKDMDLSRGTAVLSNPVFKKIAVASPQLAPYGRQALKVMEQVHLYPGIASRLVYGESIAQVNQFITTQSADIGFTAKSVVMAANMKNQGVWVDVDPALYEAIAQSAVILKHAVRHQEPVNRFFEFLFSDYARNIFQKYGYR